MYLRKLPARLRAAALLLLGFFLHGCDMAGQAGVPTQPTAGQQAAQDDKVFAAAYAAYERNDDATALAGFTAIAARKPDAKFMLGTMVQEGRGTAPDKARSYQLLSEAARAGSHSAASVVGFMQIIGNGVEWNPEAGAALLRFARADPNLRESVRTNALALCPKAQTQLESLPSLFDMVKRHMPAKAALCAVAAVTSDASERVQYSQCVRELCSAEEAFGEANSCDAMQRESQRVEKQRDLLKRTLTVLECGP